MPTAKVVAAGKFAAAVAASPDAPKNARKVQDYSSEISQKRGQLRSLPDSPDNVARRQQIQADIDTLDQQRRIASADLMNDLRPALKKAIPDLPDTFTVEQLNQGGSPDAIQARELVSSFLDDVRQTSRQAVADTGVPPDTPLVDSVDAQETLLSKYGPSVLLMALAIGGAVGATYGILTETAAAMTGCYKVNVSSGEITRVMCDPMKSDPNRCICNDANRAIIANCGYPPCSDDVKYVWKEYDAGDVLATMVEAAGDLTRAATNPMSWLPDLQKWGIYFAMLAGIILGLIIFYYFIKYLLRQADKGGY